MLRDGRIDFRLLAVVTFWVLEGKKAVKKQNKTINMSWYYFDCYKEHVFHDLNDKILLKENAHISNFW